MQDPNAHQHLAPAHFGQEYAAGNVHQPHISVNGAAIPGQLQDPNKPADQAAYDPSRLGYAQFPNMVMNPLYRMPVSNEVAEEEPLYVNAKQYHRILKRRAARARLEEQNKMSKTRKPYLHAMRRPRGPGGRFLKKEEIEQLQKAQEQENREQNGQQQSHQDINQENPKLPDGTDGTA
ncbi:uncharacterized protein VTP21DRAFT_3629 [Calcarisporiella thermophila]|uniref:uncharacterized protein n=1 Tax=Calcarisporiella thermophila TaxID=911321 RepID=UPI0037421D68